jgi:hypothetical protein
MTAGRCRVPVCAKALGQDSAGIKGLQFGWSIECAAMAATRPDRDSGLQRPWIISQGLGESLKVINQGWGAGKTGPFILEHGVLCQILPHLPWDWSLGSSLDGWVGGGTKLQFLLQRSVTGAFMHSLCQSPCHPPGLAMAPQKSQDTRCNPCKMLGSCSLCKMKKSLFFKPPPSSLCQARNLPGWRLPQTKRSGRQVQGVQLWSWEMMTPNTM